MKYAAVMLCVMLHGSIIRAAQPKVFVTLVVLEENIKANADADPRNFRPVWHDAAQEVARHISDAMPYLTWVGDVRSRDQLLLEPGCVAVLEVLVAPRTSQGGLRIKYELVKLKIVKRDGKTDRYHQRDSLSRVPVLEMYDNVDALGAFVPANNPLQLLADLKTSFERQFTDEFAVILKQQLSPLVPLALEAEVREDGHTRVLVPVAWDALDHKHDLLFRYEFVTQPLRGSVGDELPGEMYLSPLSPFKQGNGDTTVVALVHECKDHHLNFPPAKASEVQVDCPHAVHRDYPVISLYLKPRHLERGEVYLEPRMPAIEQVHLAR